jgi:lipopolysaccharide assembly outer membrane protein LptD (OstA)
MKSQVFAVVTVALSGAVALAGQDTRASMNRCLAEVVRARLESDRPIRVSGDAITLTGDTLHLSGHAWVRSDDMAIRADEIVLDRTGSTVDLLGHVLAISGSSFRACYPSVRPPQYK